MGLLDFLRYQNTQINPQRHGLGLLERGKDYRQQKIRDMAMQGLLPSAKYQSLADNAPVGAVGAPGGLLTYPQAPERPGMNALQMAGMAPGLGDILGPLGDAQMFYTQPETRTPLNFGLAGLGLLPLIPSMTVFHGSPHLFDKFDASKIGTGEGAQAYGHGLYLAESPDVAKTYVDLQGVKRPRVYADGKRLDVHTLKEGVADDIRMNGEAIAAIHAKYNGPEFVEAFNELKGKTIEQRWDKVYENGNLYTVDLPDDTISAMLDWDKPLSEQPESVRKALRPIVDNFVEKQAKDAGSWGAPAEEMEIYRKQGREIAERKRGEEWYQMLFHQERKRVGPNSGASAYSASVSERLKELGIPGIKYFDGGSRAAGDGTRNFVVFDDKLLKVLERNGEPVKGLLK